MKKDLFAGTANPAGAHRLDELRANARSDGLPEGEPVEPVQFPDSRQYVRVNKEWLGSSGRLENGSQRTVRRAIPPDRRGVHLDCPVIEC